MIKRNTKIPIYKIENKLFPNTSKHKKKKLIKRKKELYSLAIKSNTFYKNNLIDMIKGNYLDNIINEINDIHTTDINNSCLIKNGYLTGNEQFISLLTFLIIKTIENFNFIKINKTELLSHIFYNNNNYQFLLVKKYIGNNDNIPYFRYHIKRFIKDGLTADNQAEKENFDMECLTYCAGVLFPKYLGMKLGRTVFDVKEFTYL